MLKPPLAGFLDLSRGGGRDPKSASSRAMTRLEASKKFIAKAALSLRNLLRQVSGGALP